MTFGKNPRRVRSRKDERDPMDRFLADRRRTALAAKAEPVEIDDLPTYPEEIGEDEEHVETFAPHCPETGQWVGSSFCCF